MNTVGSHGLLEGHAPAEHLRLPAPILQHLRRRLNKVARALRQSAHSVARSALGGLCWN